jgi:MATE family multidrug resistance protein
MLLIALQRPLAAAIYHALGGSDAVRAAAETYFFVRVWSAPCALANFAVLGWLVGIARAGTALALQIAINLINMAATTLLVLVFDCGIAGAAWAAVLAETAGLAIGLSLAWFLAGRHFKKVAAVGVVRRDRLLRMLAINRDIMIRTAAIISAYAFFTAQGARASDVALAANAVLHNFILIGSFFLDGFAAAAEQLCGRAIGARDGQAFADATRRVLAWGFLFGMATTIFILFVGNPLIDAITTSDPVRQAARQFVLFAALAPVLGVAAYAFDGIYIGATWARDMRNLMLAALAIYLATWWALRPYGNSGLWIALLTFLAARGLLQAARYPRLAAAAFP